MNFFQDIRGQFPGGLGLLLVNKFQNMVVKFIIKTNNFRFGATVYPAWYDRFRTMNILHF